MFEQLSPGFRRNYPAFSDLQFITFLLLPLTVFEYSVGLEPTDRSILYFFSLMLCTVMWRLLRDNNNIVNI